MVPPCGTIIPIRPRQAPRKCAAAAAATAIFNAQTISWIDAARTPRVKQELLRGEFNVVSCPACGYRQFVGAPFFYEDFEEGLLVALFPRTPEERERVEA